MQTNILWENSQQALLWSPSEKKKKKSVARENYWNGIYKGTHMILYRLQIKWQGSIWDKDLREFNLSFLGQWKSLIEETQPEINKQTNSVPTTTSHDFISL